MQLYISNLGHQVTEESLHAIFSTHGSVESVRIILDQFSGRSNGVAYVIMHNEAEALRAVSRIHGCVLNGRSVSVEAALGLVSLSGASAA